MLELQANISMKRLTLIALLLFAITTTVCLGMSYWAWKSDPPEPVIAEKAISIRVVKDVEGHCWGGEFYNSDGTIARYCRHCDAKQTKEVTETWKDVKR